MNLSAEGQKVVDEIAQRHGFSADAVTAMLQAVAQGGGTMAQFSHPEFGGMGQWTRGGMIMIGDMFNNALKARVDALCLDLADAIGRMPPAPAPAPSSSQWQSQSGTGMPASGQWQGQGGGAAMAAGAGGSGVSLFVPMPGMGSGNWWPDGLGVPASSGAQNDIRYAWFPSTRRLAIAIGGRVVVYDSGDHQIGGVSQQQGGGASVTFTSQFGTVRLSDLPVVSDPAATAGASAPPVEAAPAASPEASAPPAETTPAASPTASAPPVEAEVSEAKPSEAKASKAKAPKAKPSEAKVSEAKPAAPAPAAPPPPPASGGTVDIFATIEKLADLRSKGVLSEEEFAAKKQELLSRL